MAECTGHCPDQLLDSLAQSELTRKALSVLCPDDKLCVCVLDCTAPFVLSFKFPFPLFFKEFVISFVLHSFLKYFQPTSWSCCRRGWTCWEWTPTGTTTRTTSPLGWPT